MRKLTAVAAAVLTVAGAALIQTPALSATSPEVGAAPNRIAFITGNASNLPTPDAILVSVLVDAGYDVLPIDDDELADMSESIADQAEIGIIASSVLPTKIPAALATSPLPMLNLEGFVSDELGLATRAGEQRTNKNSIIMNPAMAGSPLAAGLTGFVGVNKSAQTTQNFGVVGGDAMVIATTNGRPRQASYYAYEAGSELANGEAAPARRVAHFPAYAAPFTLTADGVSLFAASVAWLFEAPPVHLQLLGINDYHGHVESTSPGNIEGAPAGGSEYLSAKLNELRQGNKNSLTVAAGDLIGGSPAFSGLFHDEPSVETLNAMQLDVSSVGNHEFDEGVTELLRMQNGGCHPVDGCYFPDEPYPGADFQWLAANVVHETTGETPLPPYWIEQVEDVNVGFIGMTLEATDTLVAAAGIQGWDFLDEAETANALVPILKAQGVEAIVVLLHEGGSQTPPPGDVDACVGISGPIVQINNALDPEIDVVITGHTHLPYNCVLDDPAGEPRIVTSAYSFGRVVTEVNLVLDTETNDVNRDLSTSTNHAVIQADLVKDPAMTSIIDKWTPLFDAAGNTPVGTITADINRGGTGGSDRGVESAAGNLVADAQLWATSSNFAEIAFMNPGGLRSDLTFAESQAVPEGDGVVTFGEAFTFQPFGNTLVTYEMTGAQIVSVLEEQCQPIGSSRPFLHLGVSTGFTYDLATTIVEGNCTSITVSNVQLNGAALDPTGTYNVTVNNFLADGGDNFTTLGTVSTPRLDGGNDLQAFTNYLGTFSPVAPPSIDRVNELP